MSANEKAKHASAMTMPSNSTISAREPWLLRRGTRELVRAGHGRGAAPEGRRAAARGAGRRAAQRGARDRRAGSASARKPPPPREPRAGRTSEAPGSKRASASWTSRAAGARDRAGAVGITSSAARPGQPRGDARRANEAAPGPRPPARERAAGAAGETIPRPASRCFEATDGRLSAVLRVRAAGLRVV